MAKKKRGPGRPPKKKSSSKVSHSVPTGFWRQVGAVFLIIISILLALGLFGIGGSLPVNLAGVTKWLIGWAAFVAPVLFVYQSIQVFRAEKNKLSGAVWVVTIIFLALFAGIFQLLLDDPQRQAMHENPLNGEGGGAIGWLVDVVLLQWVSVGVAALILIVINLTLLLFVASSSPAAVINGIRNFFGRESDEAAKKNEKIIREGQIKNVKISGLDDNEDKVIKPIKTNFGADEKPEKIDVPLAKINDSDWKYPSIELLSDKNYKADPGDVALNTQIIEDTLSQFGIKGRVEEVNVGPRVTQYAVKLDRGIAPSRVVAQENTLAMNLEAERIRIQAPIPGRQYVGIEIPNKKPAFISMRSLLTTNAWQNSKNPLEFVVGKDILGKPIMTDLHKLPHLLIAGTTGSGKSVMMNTIVTSLLLRGTPNDVKFVMIDPKGNEMDQYNDMPHLMLPVVNGTDDEYIKNAAGSLRAVTNEMDRRFKILNEKGVDKIETLNEKYPDETLPYIVVVIDEYTDLLDVARKAHGQMRDMIQGDAQRIAQKGRAVGIHDVILMQAPRKEYIQGVFKANIPARFCFEVLNKMESNIILNKSGGEKLMGHGDMLYVGVDNVKEPTRVQAVAIEKTESKAIADFLKIENGMAQYDPDGLNVISGLASMNPTSGGLSGGSDLDPQFREAMQIFIDRGEASGQALGTYLRIGFGRQARIMAQAEQRGYIGPKNGSKPREVLISSIDEIE